MCGFSQLSLDLSFNTYDPKRFNAETLNSLKYTLHQIKINLSQFVYKCELDRSLQT